MPVEKVKVQELTGQKIITWAFPYLRTTQDPQSGVKTLFAFPCRYLRSSNVEEYEKWRDLITNGYVTVNVFECDRGLAGLLRQNIDDLETAMMYPPRTGTIGEYNYFKVCTAVNHKAPYPPSGS